MLIYVSMSAAFIPFVDINAAAIAIHIFTTPPCRSFLLRTAPDVSRLHYDMMAQSVTLSR
jgi:hypothetical protein